MLLVAEAYASWWSLSNEPSGGEMSDYVDPKQFQQGAEDARLKAIAYFEQVLQLVPGTELGQDMCAPSDYATFNNQVFLPTSGAVPVPKK